MFICFHVVFPVFPVFPAFPAFSFSFDFFGLRGIDYFMYTPNLWTHVPDFLVGRFAWDNWVCKPGGQSIPLPERKNKRDLLRNIIFSQETGIAIASHSRVPCFLFLSSFLAYVSSVSSCPLLFRFCSYSVLLFFSERFQLVTHGVRSQHTSGPFDKRENFVVDTSDVVIDVHLNHDYTHAHKHHQISERNHNNR